MINKYFDHDRERRILKHLLSCDDEERRFLLTIVRAERFDNKLHAHIISVIKHLDNNQKPVSFQAAKDYINLNEKDRNIEALTKLLTDIYKTKDSNHVEQDIEYLSELFQNRIIDDEIVTNTKKMLIENKPAKEIIDFVQKALGQLILHEDKSIEDAMEDVHKYILQAQKSGPKILKTGWKEYDEAIGIRKRRYFCCAALSSVGKSFANYARIIGILKNNDWETFALKFYSLEIPKDELLLWLVSCDTGISYGRLEGKGIPLSAEDLESIVKTKEWLAKAPLSIDDGINYIADVEMKSKKFILQNAGKHCVIFLDHHLKVAQKIADKRIHVSDLSGMLQNLAKHYDCTVFLLAQLRRELLHEANRENLFKPSSEYIQESGSIFQDCNHVELYWRPAMYKGDNIPDEHEFYFVIEKNKTGQTMFEIVLRCTPKCGRIFDPVLPFAETLPGEEKGTVMHVSTAVDDEDDLPF